jgi:undecaprenyl-diphosphatase
VFHLLNGAGPAWMDWIFQALSSRIFDFAAAVIATLLLILTFRRKGILTVAMAWLALGITDGIGAWLLKPLFHRTRPCYALEIGTFRQLLPVGHSGSMPSLHAANAFAFALIIALQWPAVGIPSLALALLIGISRIYVGVHWPSDVVAGVILGSAVSLLIWRLGERFRAQATIQA